MQTFGTETVSIRPLTVSFAGMSEAASAFPLSSVNSPPPSLQGNDTSSSVSSVLSTTSSGSSSSSRDLRRNLLIKELGLGNIIVPKNRRIYDLNNVPLVSGQAYVKWHIEGLPRADCRGRTNREPIKEHKVMWNYSHTIPAIRMIIGKQNMLQDLNIVFEIHQEYSGGRERIQLGSIKLNLAVYAGLDRETRRYLMRHSKINSTVKIGIDLCQISGDRHFNTPPLKGSQVFSGIAGIIGEQRDLDDTRDLKLLESRNREAGAKQDMYRRTLASTWHLQTDELNPDECIEDIFAGGDGWVGNRSSRKPKSVQLFEPGDSGSERKDKGSDSDSLSQLSQLSHLSVSAGGSTPTTTSATEDKPVSSTFLVSTTAEPPGSRKKGYAEVDEIEARDDFVSWRVPPVPRR